MTALESLDKIVETLKILMEGDSRTMSNRETEDGQYYEGIYKAIKVVEEFSSKVEKDVFVVTEYYQDIKKLEEPIVTVFDNEGEATKYHEYLKDQGKLCCIDKCSVYRTAFGRRLDVNGFNKTWNEYENADKASNKESE